MSGGETSEETSAGGVVYRAAGGETKFLLIRDSYKNWGFPKGHLHEGEPAEAAAMREVAEETGLGDLTPRGALGEIDWWFRFRGKRIHKVCHFFLIESHSGDTTPQRAEGITECRWLTASEASKKVSYPNAREVLERAVSLLGIGPP